MVDSQLVGRRIHIVGSASRTVERGVLDYAHSVIQQLTRCLVTEGATFVIPFGKEPLLNDQADSPAIIFDWSVAEILADAIKNGDAPAIGPNGRLIATVSTTRTDDNIPSQRRAAYNELRDANAIELRFLASGWTAGALQRQALGELGDVLIAVSGGQGVEQLAIEYSARGKPVIPLDLDLGASSDDGSGGAARLFNRALEDPKKFFQVKDGTSTADLLDRTRTRNGQSDAATVAKALIDLLRALTRPRAFYVRLLNDKLPEFPHVEKFFRTCVDPVVTELRYEPLEMGKGPNEFAWMNEAIFQSLHHSSVAVVDITGLRPNCFVEMGYALGNAQRVILTARKGTEFPFDVFAIEGFLWKEDEPVDDQVKRLRTHWERSIDMPKLVRPNQAR